MAKKVEELNLNSVEHLSKASDLFFMGADLFIMMNIRELGIDHILPGQPYRVEEGRVILVKEGWGRVVVNLEEIRLSPHDVLVLFPDSTFEIQELGEDFNLSAFNFKSGPYLPSTSSHWHASLDEEDWTIAGLYIDLLWREMHREPLIEDAIAHLHTSLLFAVKHVAEKEAILRRENATRREVLFHQFLELVNTNGLKERRMEWYAGKLCITPNHLGAVVKNASGLTVMQWLNRYTIQNAKVLLRYSELSIWEIAEKLNFANPSFFSKFFKKETGMTPGQYRKSV